MAYMPQYIESHRDFCAENVTNSMLNIVSVKKVKILIKNKYLRNIPVKKKNRECLFLLAVMISSNPNKDEVESKKQEKLVSAQRLAVL